LQCTRHGEREKGIQLLLAVKAHNLYRLRVTFRAHCGILIITLATTFWNRSFRCLQKENSKIYYFYVESFCWFIHLTSRIGHLQNLS